MGSPRPPCFAIQHTILVIAISCNSQVIHRFLCFFLFEGERQHQAQPAVGDMLSQRKCAADSFIFLSIPPTDSYTVSSTYVCCVSLSLFKRELEHQSHPAVGDMLPQRKRAAKRAADVFSFFPSHPLIQKPFPQLDDPIHPLNRFSLFRR